MGKTAIAMISLLLAALALSACAGSQQEVKTGEEIQAGPVQRVALIMIPGEKVTARQLTVVRATVARQIARRYRLEVLAGAGFEQALWGGTAAAAPGSAQQFRRALARARQAVERLQLGKAIELLQGARQLLDDCGPWLKREELAELFVVAGKLHASQEQVEQATESFRHAVELDPQGDPSRFRLDERQLELFEQARRQVTSGMPHELSLVTTPPGAEAIVDGITRGQTPVTVQLYSGRHFIRLTKAGFLGWTRSLPDGVPPPKITARLYKVWPGPALGELKDELFEPRPETEAVAAMKKLASFYGVGALVLIGLDSADDMLQASIRLFFLAEGVFTRPLFVNLGKSAKGWKVTARNLSASFKQLKKSRPAKKRRTSTKDKKKKKRRGKKSRGQKKKKRS